MSTTKEEHNAYHRAYYKKNKERVHAKNRKWEASNKERHRQYVNRYAKSHARFRLKGITKEIYDAMCLQQQGKCKICLRPHDNLHIDHCHKTNKVRGLLCGNCNRGLGIFKDSPRTLMRAAAYLSCPTNLLH